MSVILFVLILLVLILVHEYGHLLAAKASGMKVEEFGIGFPPKVLSLSKLFRLRGETEYTVNALPLGGFVRIYGEDGAVEGSDAARAFSARPKILQAFVLVAGVLMNALLAWVLISGLLMASVPRGLSTEEVLNAREVTLTVSAVVPDSPAARAGVLPGDAVLSLKRGEEVVSPRTPEEVTAFVAAHEEAATLTVSRTGEALVFEVAPEEGVLAADPSRKAIGLATAVSGILPLPVHEALWRGAGETLSLLGAVARGLGDLAYGALTMSADLSAVSGPVGIAGAVGTAADRGIADLVFLTALISLNLAVINLVPFPALDGGRLLFLLAEALLRRPIPRRVADTANTVGFALLILLMVAVTVSDIGRLL